MFFLFCAYACKYKKISLNDHSKYSNKRLTQIHFGGPLNFAAYYANLHSAIQASKNCKKVQYSMHIQNIVKIRPSHSYPLSFDSS
jgi:hypothetical protein